MKVYAVSKLHSLAVDRVVSALYKYSPPHIEFVDNPKIADLILMHINGRLKTNTRTIEYYNKPHVIIQYAVKSTLNEDPAEWMPMWQGAELVWSYLPLKGDFVFYHSPLGVESDIFYNRSKRRIYNTMTTGSGYLSETVREVILASRRVGYSVVHLGSDFKKAYVDKYVSGISDNELAELYSQCEYVSGLRRNEGFELPAAEGLMCGARPILYDRKHYKDWYDGLALFIPETDRDQIVVDLEALYRFGLVPVTPDEMAEAKDRFDWKQILKGFWSYL